VAGNVTVNRAAMVTAAQQVENALGEIKGYQTRMNGYHADLVGSWQGQASAAFTSAYEAFSSDFTIVTNALNAIHEKLVGTHANYNTVETANAQGMSKIASALNA
jgi:WXG100 family type VII secretion target